jgi:hypothetical protein
MCIVANCIILKPLLGCGYKQLIKSVFWSDFCVCGSADQTHSSREARKPFHHGALPQTLGVNFFKASALLHDDIIYLRKR